MDEPLRDLRCCGALKKKAKRLDSIENRPRPALMQRNAFRL
jgi:hypothetical protein